MEGRRLDWSHDVTGSDEGKDFYRYDQNHLDVGEVGYKALATLSVDASSIAPNRHGWIAADVDSLRCLGEIDTLAALMVPPETTPLDNRTRANELLRDLHGALPFTEAERWWLLNDALVVTRRYNAKPHDEDYLEPVKAQEAELVTNGLRRVTNGRELLQRFWSWRREVGEYSSGEGLAQAREALAGLIGLLTPELGLPDEYQALQIKS